MSVKIYEEGIFFGKRTDKVYGAPVMRKIRIYLLLQFCLCLLIWPHFGIAAIPEQKNAEAIASPAVKNASADNSGVDVVLLLDCSGKMKQIDPHDYRKPAAKLFLSLLGEQDAVSIIGFGDSAREITPLTRNDAKNREKLFKGIDNITAKEFNTNITGALQSAYDRLKTSAREKKAIILLSNGVLDLGSPAENESSYKELKQLLPVIARTGIVIHAIAFTELTEMGLLAEIAEATKGSAVLARSDKDLHAVFASTFEKIKSPDALPLQGDSFFVDQNIQEITLLVTKKKGTSTGLTDPRNQTHMQDAHAKNFLWYQSTAFDMITVTAPEVGTWKVNLSSTEGNKIFIVTDLKLKGLFDRDVVGIGEKNNVNAWLEKYGAVLREPEFLDQMTMYAEVSTPDRKTRKIELPAGKAPGQGGVKTGIFSGEVSGGAAGTYKIVIKVEGKTFQREKTCEFQALESVSAAGGRNQMGFADSNAGTPSQSVDWKYVLGVFASVNLILACAVSLFVIAVRQYKKLAMKRLRKTIGQSASELQQEKK